MKTAQQIRKDYQVDLESMRAEASTWSLSYASAYEGLREWFFYSFKDGSRLEFEVLSGKTLNVTDYLN